MTARAASVALLLAAVTGAGCRTAAPPVGNATLGGDGAARTASPVAASGASCGLKRADGARIAIAEPAKSTALTDVLATECAAAAALGENTAAVAVSAPVAAPGYEDKGDFVLVSAPGGGDNPLRIGSTVLFEQLLPELNARLKLPRDIPVVLTKCGTPNAYWHPGRGEILMCDEWPAMLFDLYGSYKPTEEDALTATMAATMFTFLHEVGHCLIDQYELPSTGREEDAADQLATLLVVSDDKASTDIAVSGAESWLAIQVLRGDNKGDYWDEHSLDEVRFYNIMCLVYGSDPKAHADLVADGDLPRARAVRCEKEFQKTKTSWERLLAPFEQDLAKRAYSPPISQGSRPMATTRSRKR